MTHKITFQWGTPGQVNALIGTISKSADAEKNMDPAISANQTNKAIDYQLVIARAKMLVLMATVDMTVKTNSSGSPANTFSLKANEPFVWTVDQGTLQDSSAVDVVDITHLYVTNTTAGTLSIRSLYDPAG
jgi:hypothetical protein